MRMRWRLVLCSWGNALFAALTWHAVRFNRDMHPDRSSRYFWWGASRLDTDPLNKRPLNNGRPQPCKPDTANCIEWDPELIWVASGLMQGGARVHRNSSFSCRTRNRPWLRRTLLPFVRRFHGVEKTAWDCARCAELHNKLDGHHISFWGRS